MGLKPPGCSQHLYKTSLQYILLEDISELKDTPSISVF